MYHHCQNYPSKKPVAESEENECLFRDFYALAKRSRRNQIPNIPANLPLISSSEKPTILFVAERAFGHREAI